MTIEITDEMRKVAGAAVHDHLYDKPAPDYASPTGDDFQDIGLAALTAALPIIEKQARPEEAQPDAVRVGDETPLTLDQYQQFSKNIQTTLARGLTTLARIIEGGDK